MPKTPTAARSPEAAALACDSPPPKGCMLRCRGRVRTGPAASRAQAHAPCSTGAAGVNQKRERAGSWFPSPATPRPCRYALSHSITLFPHRSGTPWVRGAYQFPTYRPRGGRTSIRLSGQIAGPRRASTNRRHFARSRAAGVKPCCVRAHCARGGRRAASGGWQAPLQGA